MKAPKSKEKSPRTPSKSRVPGRAGKVGSRELKTRLGSYLQRVRAGARFVVTDRGEPVAELRPFAEEGADGIPARLAALDALGVVSWTGDHPLPPFEAVALDSDEPISATLLRDREDRF